MSAMTTFMPAPRNACAMPKPTPLAPPVMNATLPSTCCMSDYLTRYAEHLRPVDAVLTLRIHDDGDTHLDETRIHDVFAVRGATEPAVHHLLGRRRSACDVLADDAPEVACATRAILRRAAVASRMRNRIVLRHVL